MSWQQDSAVLIGLSLQWHVLHQLIGLYQKTLNNIDVMFRKHDGSIRLHVVSKNLQSIRTEARFNDFLVETVSCDFDVLFVSETWRDAKEESYTAIRGNRMYFSGGLAHQGVGVIIGNIFHSKLRDISFHVYSPRICVLKCSLGMLKLELFAVYFPTSWDDILEMEGLYTLLQVLLDNCVSRGAYPILGGDFNACVGPVSRSDDVDLVGCFGFGERNAQGMLLAQWVMQNGLYIANRQKPTHQIEDSWTCRRSSDGTLTQIDFIVLDRRTLFDNTWNDYVIPIGLDHRCAHCTFHFNTSRVARRARLQKMKNWEPTLDEDGRPAKYHHEIQRRLSTSRRPSVS